MQRRQNWMRDFLIEEKENPLAFVGSVGVNANIMEVAVNIRQVLGLTENWAKDFHRWEDALAALREAVDGAGILIAKNGIVGNNTHRKLDVEDFRGFVLVDSFAPLMFVNGSDYEGAQMFTIAHELAHLWLGKSAVFNLLRLQPFENEIEVFCNEVAAEFLVPEKELRGTWRNAAQTRNPYDTLARQFKVSTLVVARRALDLQFINRDQFFKFYYQYRDNQAKRLKKKKKGGDFYNNQNVRVGKRFASAVIRAAKEGRLLYHDAFRLTGLYGNVFDEYSKKLGFNG
jgi:Zn-dependent peptidase ImmA (M78 family)